MKTIEQILSAQTTQQNPLIISKAELELIHEIELQPVKKTLQVVGTGSVIFLGVKMDFEADIASIKIQEVDTQITKEIWYRIDYSIN